MLILAIFWHFFDFARFFWKITAPDSCIYCRKVIFFIFFMFFSGFFTFFHFFEKNKKLYKKPCWPAIFGWTVKNSLKSDPIFLRFFRLFYGFFRFFPIFLNFYPNFYPKPEYGVSSWIPDRFFNFFIIFCRFFHFFQFFPIFAFFCKNLKNKSLRGCFISFLKKPSQKISHFFGHFSNFYRFLTIFDRFFCLFFSLFRWPGCRAE